MIVIGHRGARGLAPENTLASLRKALEYHVDMIEFDIRVTKDGVPVLHHDAKLIDPDGSKHPIADTDYKTLRTHKSDLTTLEEALDACAGKVPLYIEVKQQVSTEPIVKVIKSCSAPEDLFLASKSQKTLLALHRGLPQLPTIVIEPWSGVRAHFRAHQLGTKLVAMNQRWLWWGFIRGFKNNGWQLYAYTLNDPAKARRWARWGLAGAVTDHPERFK